VRSPPNPAISTSTTTHTPTARGGMRSAANSSTDSSAQKPAVVIRRGLPASRAPRHASAAK